MWGCRRDRGADVCHPLPVLQGRAARALQAELVQAERELRELQRQMLAPSASRANGRHRDALKRARRRVNQALSGLPGFGTWEAGRKCVVL